MTDYYILFLTGLFGSLHCLGMCGPIILAYSFNPAGKNGKIIPHLYYNIGRMISYTIAGFILGLFGSLLFSIVPYQIYKFYFLLVGGSLIVLLGLGLMNIIPKFHLSFDGLHTKLTKSIFIKRLSNKTDITPLIIGLATILLPCGLFYPILLKAAMAGDAVSGGISMFVFSIGTVPLLFVLGFSSQFIGHKLRKTANYLAAAAVIIMGVMLIYKAFMFQKMMSCMCH